MREERYDRLGPHKQDHERLLDDLRDIMDAFEQSEEVDAVELATRLDTWFTRHFRTHDGQSCIGRLERIPIETVRPIPGLRDHETTAPIRRRMESEPMLQQAEKPPVKPAPTVKEAAFNWQDPLDLEGELGEEERMVRDTARGYAQEQAFSARAAGLSRRALRSRHPHRDGGARPARADASRSSMAAPGSAMSPTG